MASRSESRRLRRRGERRDPEDVVRTGFSGRYRRDLYVFLLDSSWPRLITVFALLYLLVNCLFALGYLLTGNGVENARPGSFADVFFFSVQTMATIGFGKMWPRTMAAHVLVTIEAFTTLLALALSTGLFFAKFSRPSARVLFSTVAVVAPWDGVPSLMFRVANERDNRIIDAQVQVALLRAEVTAESVSVRRVHDLELLRKRHPTFALSWTAVHPIDERSPLLGATAASLAAADAFIIVSLTGLDETYSQTVHARHTYLPDDIVWDARFADILSRRPDGRTVFDYRLFHDTIPIRSVQASASGDRHDQRRP